MKIDKTKLIPFILTGIVILADQITKAIIVYLQPIPTRWTPIADVFNNGIFQIIHVRNPHLAFSLGQNLPEFIRPVILVILPILVLVVLIVYYFYSSDFTRLQRWAVAGIIGGGIGNLIDRIFRPDGVVDFLDVQMPGWFVWDRWPTFNIADSAVVVCCFILFFSILFTRSKPKEAK